MVPVRVLIPSGALGLGFDADAFEAGLARNPDIIAIDGGSTDSGPYYLGTGSAKYSHNSIKREWQILMEARERLGVPLLIGTAGTCGSKTAVDQLVDITQQIASQLGHKLKLAILYSDQNPSDLSVDQLTALEPQIEVSQEIVNDCTNIVALAGAEQIQSALDTGADIVIAGRATDTAVISALPLARGCDPGASWHGAKIGECGALATTNPTSGTILIEFDKDGFVVEPMAADARATPRTVSAHMLYENSDPFVLYEPGGHLDVREANYEQLDARRVRVTGSKWVPNPVYTVKLEGARQAGFQTTSMVMVRDERYVRNIEDWLKGLRAYCEPLITTAPGQTYDLEFRLIGQNATLGELENKSGLPVEIGVLCIVTATTQELATEIAKLLNPQLLHMPLTADEPLPTFAFPYSPAETERGPLYEFCLNHVMELSDPMQAFELKVLEIRP